MTNRPDGYRVPGIDPVAAEHLHISTLPASIGDRFGIASDGFLRLIELFDIATPNDLLAIDRMESLDTWLDRLRTLERAPRSQQLFPRVKESDDATLLTCAIR